MIQREFLVAGDDGAALDGCGRDDDPVEGIGVMSRKRANRFHVLKGDWQFAESSIRDRIGGTPRGPETRNPDGQEPGRRSSATGKEVSRPLFPEEVARNFSARYYKDGSEILIQRRRGNPRRLTPRECARLMGFDREGAPPFRIVVSDTQAYKQFGSATAVPVVEAIAWALAPSIAGTKPAKRRKRGTA